MLAEEVVLYSLFVTNVKFGNLQLTKQFLVDARPIDDRNKYFVYIQIVAFMANIIIIYNIKASIYNYMDEHLYI